MAQRNTTGRKKVRRGRLAFFSSITPQQKSTILKYSGVVIFAFTLFTFISAASYLFTWKTDMSLMSHPDMMPTDVEVANWGGKLGYGLGSFLVARCFGLGSFAFIFLLGAVAYRLFFVNRRISLLRTAFVTVSALFLSLL